MFVHIVLVHLEFPSHVKQLQLILLRISAIYVDDDVINGKCGTN